jgi:HEAT repeat protein
VATDPGKETVDFGTLDKAVEAELKQAMGRFTLSFLKALMTTGIYPPDHPAVVGVATEPFDMLKRLEPHSSELTFQGASSGIGDDLTLEGLLPEGIPFSSLVQSSLSEHFARKFLNYFERNHLVSFSVKPRIGREEFNRLVSVFAEHRVSEEQRGVARVVSFSDLLGKAGIVHVTAMAREEVIGGDRVLPWRVKMAISRLRKDLRTVPLYSEATQQQLQDAKMMLIQDITRPLRKPQFLKDLLANTDLVTAGVEELAQLDIEREIIECLHPGMLTAVSWDIVGEMDQVSWGEIRVAEGATSRRLDTVYKGILKSVSLRLREVDPGTTRELLRYLFLKRILAYQELPVVLQKEVLAEKWTTQFLASPDQVIARFSGLGDSRTYAQYIETFGAILPELVGRTRHAEYAGICAALRAHAVDRTPGLEWRVQTAEDTLRQFATPDMVARISQLAGSDDKDVRGPVIRCLCALGEESISALLAALASSRSATARRDLMAAIEGFGDDALVPLLEVLSARGHEWFVYRNTILMLGRLEQVAAVDDVRRFLGHAHPRVRDEALVALEKLAPDDLAHFLLPFCSEPGKVPDRKIIAVLARKGCREPPFLDMLARVAGPPGEKETPPPDELLLVSLDAIGRLGPFASNGVDVRELLLRRLEGEESMLKRLLKKRSRRQDGDVVRAATIATLGQIGDIDTARRLEAFLEDDSSVVRERTAEAVRIIAVRARPGG